MNTFFFKSSSILSNVQHIFACSNKVSIHFGEVQHTIQGWLEWKTYIHNLKNRWITTEKKNVTSMVWCRQACMTNTNEKNRMCMRIWFWNSIFCQNRFIRRFVVSECSLCLLFFSFEECKWSVSFHVFYDGVLFITCKALRNRKKNTTTKSFNLHDGWVWEREKG